MIPVNNYTKKFIKYWTTNQISYNMDAAKEPVMHVLYRKIVKR